MRLPFRFPPWRIVPCVGFLVALSASAEAQLPAVTTCTQEWQQQRMALAEWCPVQPDAAAPLDTVPHVPVLVTTKPVRPDLARALGGVAFANLMAVGINNLARSLPSTRPETWWRNVQGGWNWDDNNISTNNIEHPVGGAVYYNIARANGFSFWGSAPLTAAGSLMWELFGEPTPPAKNDVITTTLGGISMGETVLRISNLILNNEASGLDRVWREAAVAIINPGLGLTRLARGEAWRAGPNLPVSRPVALRTELLTGARRLSTPGITASGQVDQAFAAFGMEYGDPFADGPTAPFSSFAFDAMLSTGEITITQVATRGMLTSFGRHTGSTSRVNGLFMDLDFQWNEAYMFGEQSFGVGTLSRTGSAGGWRLNTDLSAELAPLVASADPYANALVDREYDYGAGIGGRAGIQLEHRGFRTLSARYRGYWTRTVNGASDTKLTQFLSLEARTPLAAGLSAGGSYTMYSQRSTYADLPTGVLDLPIWSVFISSGR
jgi:hypothetical protein